MTKENKSLTAKGTELWREAKANGAKPVEWDELSPEEQAAATRAGTALWREVTGRNEPEVEL